MNASEISPASFPAGPTPPANFSQAVCVNTALIDIRLGESGKCAAIQNPGMGILRRLQKPNNRHLFADHLLRAGLCQRWAGSKYQQDWATVLREPLAGRGRKSQCGLILPWSGEVGPPGVGRGLQGRSSEEGIGTRIIKLEMNLVTKPHLVPIQL